MALHSALTLLATVATASSLTYDGTVLQHEYGFLTVRDTNCHVHEVDLAGFDNTSSGRRVRIVSIYDQSVGVERPRRITFDVGRGAPTNCETAGAVQSITGVIVSYSHGNGLGLLAIQPAGKRPVTFTVPMTRIDYFGNRAVPDDLASRVTFGRTRVRITFRTVMDVDGTSIEVLGVNRAP